jgi:hypothetical protein
VFTVHFQYTAFLFPVLYALTAIALPELADWGPARWLRLDGRRLVTALVVAMVATTAAVSAKYGAMVPNDAFRAGFNRPRFTIDAAGRAQDRWVAEMVATIPRDRWVITTKDLAPHVSDRRTTALFPDRWGADYLLLDTRSLDDVRTANVTKLERDGSYEVVGRHARLELLRRIPGVELHEYSDDLQTLRRRAPRDAPAEARARRTPETRVGGARGDPHAAGAARSVERPPRSTTRSAASREDQGR